MQEEDWMIQAVAMHARCEWNRAKVYRQVTHLTAALNPNVIMYAIASVLELQKSKVRRSTRKFFFF
jgi:hypothetical protein